MPRVNEKNLDGKIQEIIIKHLIYSMSFLQSPKQTAAFFSDFLTDAETIMLSKRLAIAILLLRGHSQTLITKMLSVSYSATGAVSSWIKNADPSTLVVLNTISQDDDWKEIVYDYKLVNRPVKRAGRKSKPLNQTSSVIDQQPEFEPTNIAQELESGDFEALEGPSLVEEDAGPNQAATPSMDDMLENI